jgi:hypothetical protein
MTILKMSYSEFGSNRIMSWKIWWKSPLNPKSYILFYEVGKNKKKKLDSFNADAYKRLRFGTQVVWNLLTWLVVPSIINDPNAGGLYPRRTRSLKTGQQRF